jgi:hypothetical protein
MATGPIFRYLVNENILFRQTFFTLPQKFFGIEICTDGAWALYHGWIFCTKGTLPTAGYQQQQDASNSWDAGYSRNTRNSTSKAMTLATELTEQKQGCLQQHANNIRDQQQLGQGIPATTDTHVLFVKLERKIYISIYLSIT